MSSEGSKKISRRFVVGIVAIFVLAAIGAGVYVVRGHILAHKLVTLRVGHPPLALRRRWCISPKARTFPSSAA